MNIRHSVISDLPQILKIYEHARRFMAENGNPTQWGNTNPPNEVVKADIERGKSYVCVSKDDILCVFFFDIGNDPTYDSISHGKWLNEESYGVIHRIAAAPGTKGAATFCINWCCSLCQNIRIDTHADNIPMNNLLKKLGFVRCGIIRLANKSPRVAYHKCSRL